MKTVTPLLILIALSACVEEPAPQDGEKAAVEVTTEEDAAALKAEQKSIEEAADAAAKLVEEETREEIEQLKADITE